jgi:hypothetical protein
VSGVGNEIAAFCGTMVALDMSQLSQSSRARACPRRVVASVTGHLRRSRGTLLRKFMTVFKYEAELNLRPDQPCPCPRRFVRRRLTAYRFVHNEASDVDFLPVAKIDGVKPKDKCCKFALSFFVTLEQATARYADLVDRLGDRDHAIERYGDHAGRIELSEADGLSCEPNASGHFDLHEAANVDWSNRVGEYFPLGSEA